MKVIDWNPQEWLKEHRGVCFQQVVEVMRQKRELDTVDHPNQRKYPGQKMMVVEINRYAYLVPRVDGENEIFLKTVIPSRKATKKYLRRAS